MKFLTNLYCVWIIHKYDFILQKNALKMKIWTIWPEQRMEPIQRLNKIPFLKGNQFGMWGRDSGTNSVPAENTLYRYLSSGV